VEFGFSAEDELFREEVRNWLAEHLVGEYAALGTGSDMGEGSELEVRKAWERELAEGGWVGLSWPKEYGGRDATLTQQLIFNEEYARAGGPVRAGFFGEQLLGPTLMAFAGEALKERFLPPILRAEEFWCQGFSEPDAGSDLANVKTTAVLDGDQWVINGQKVWTSLGHIADWIFVVCRTDPDAPKKHQGISFILCPVDQPGVELRPIKQLTGESEFNETFFTDARTPADMVVGPVNDGWKVVMGTLGFERGTAFLGEQLVWAAEYKSLLEFARERGATDDPNVRQRLADTYIGLELIRLSGIRTISTLLKGGNPGPEAAVSKLQWSEWHQRLGELEMDIVGTEALVEGTGRIADYQHTFLFSRAETIYSGSNEIQRNIIGERVLGLPR
jgi:alkylation response protein AidB-like acyl-CoA dehydrogenase